jgi:hypothetical protein
MLRSVIDAIGDEGGHAQTLPGTLVAAVGAVLLGIGAAGDDLGWLAIVGGIVLAAGIAAAGALHHVVVDYDIFGRLEKLEKK